MTGGGLRSVAWASAITLVESSVIALRMAMGGLSLPTSHRPRVSNAVTPNQIARARVHGVPAVPAVPVAARGRAAGRAGRAVDAAGRTELLTASLAQALQLPRANHRNHRASAHPATRMWPLLLLMTVAACGCSSLAAARSVARVPVPPTIFWHSEGQVGGSTVLALGGGLGDTLVHVCPAGTVSGGAGCQTVTPDPDTSWDGSVKFRLPGGPVVQPWSFRACAHSADDTPRRAAQPAGPCSAWHTINVPTLWWAQGDASTGPRPRATAGSTGWLRAYGRSLGVDSSGRCSPSVRELVGPAQSTKAVLVDSTDPGRTCVLETRAASCYDATFAIPACATPGNYTLQLLAHNSGASERGAVGGLMDLSFGGHPVTVEILPPRPWPSKRFPVPVGGNISAAVAAANAAGGGVVALSKGVYEMEATSLGLADGVQLVGASDGPSVLQWGQPTSDPLFANSPATGTPTHPPGPTGSQLEVSHFACDNGATWSFDNSSQQVRFNQ